MDCWGYPYVVDTYPQCRECFFPVPATVVIWKNTGEPYYVCRKHFRYWFAWAMTYGSGGLDVNPLIGLDDLRPYLPPRIESEHDLRDILAYSDGKHRHRILN